VGSSASISFPVTLLNAAVTDGIREMTSRIQAKLTAGEKLDNVLLTVLREFVKETKAIRFTGNNYSEEWVREAEKRGLPHLRTTPESLARIVDQKNKALLTQYKIFSEEELKARYHVRLERYIKHRRIEFDTLLQMADTLILPAVFRYADALAGNLQKKAALGIAVASEAEKFYLDRISKSASEAVKALDLFRKQLGELDALDSEEKKGGFIAKTMLAQSEAVRSTLDQLENMVDDSYWPLPKYGEMLFSSIL
jgi:glutamine synthetase